MALGAMGGPVVAALQAYRTAQGGAGPATPGGVTGVGMTDGGITDGGVANGALSGGQAGFGDLLQSALKGVVDQSRAAESQSLQAISGHGNLLDVVSAVSKAELSLQTTVAVRDRVVQAYQDIMRMPI